MTMRCALPTPGPALGAALMARAMVPALSAGSVRLRAVQPSDFEAFCEIVCSEQGRFIGREETPESAWYCFAPLSAGWMLHGHGGWAVDVEGETAGFVLIGLEPGDEEPELGYFFRAAFEGKGHAFSAASAALAYARTELKLPSLVSYIDPANIRSIALASRLGATADRVISDKDGDTHVYRYAMGETQ